MLLQEITPKRAGQFVDEQHVQSLIANYKKERWIHNSKRIGKADSLSVWYGLDELQEFLDTARKNGANGIKMHYGIYTEETAHNPILTGRQTIVLVATKAETNPKGSDYNRSLYINNADSPKILAFNVGVSAPPFWNLDGIEGRDPDRNGTTIIDDLDEGMIVI